MPYIPRNQSEIKQDRDFIVAYLPQLNACNTLSGKIIKLQRLCGLTNSCNKERYDICKKIHRTLLPYYPSSLLYIYGSSMNGFGTRGCDLDLLFLPYPGYCKLGTELELDDAIPNFKHIQSGKISNECLLTLGEKQHLKFILRVMSRSNFGRIVFIPAKCPILNFMARGSNSFISCDLSCRNSLVVHNTELLNFLGRIDSRVQPLVVVLRYWGKCMNFVKPGEFSAYAFTLLVIFFLQNVNPPILPSVQLLMVLSDKPNVVAGWEVGFTRSLSNVPESKNSSSVGKLFHQFFKYYWDFDFTKNVVSVRYGTVLPKKDLQKSCIERIREIEVSSICIQDPFNLSHNVSKVIKHNGLSHFKPALFIVNRMLQNFGSEISNVEFQSIFNDIEITKEIERNFSLKTVNSSLIQITLDSSIIVSLGDGVNLMKLWYKRACETVLEVLEFGLLMDCEVIDKSPILELDSSAFKIKQEEKDLCIYHCLLSIQCAVYDRVWNNRKKFSDLNGFDSDAEELSNVVLKTEHTISKSVIADNQLLSSPKPIVIFLCDCYKCEFPQLPHLYVTLKPFSSTKEFKNIFKFLEAFLPKTVAEMLSN